MAERGVVLGFSGGMDSVTAAVKLKNEGWRVVALTLDTIGDRQMVDRARTVAAEIGVCHRVIDVSDVFREKIIKYFTDSYASGRTPAPCTLCNAAIKWHYLEEQADALGIEHIATGHYFRVERAADSYYVTRAADSAKDQSYYLWGLPQRILRRVVTPMGDMIKSDVKANFADKSESMGLCFLRGMAYRDFLQQHCPATAVGGDVVDVDGQVVGRHAGVAFYTIGQKRGFECSKPGVAVVDIDAERNRLIVGSDTLLYKSTLEVGDCNLVDNNDLISLKDISVMIRGIGCNPDGYIKSVEPLPNGFRLLLDSPAWAPAIGQPVVFYRHHRVVGGGILEKYY